MASLSDQIDRFSRSTKAIKTTAEQIALANGRFTLSSIGVAGPFARAVLNTHLGDLIRDVDPSELGLFQLADSSKPPNNERVGSKSSFTPGITRVEFGNATPLRRTVARRDEPVKLSIEPDVYARAAIKYIDRYDRTRPMPRARSQVAAILQQLGDVRQNMRALAQSLEQVHTTEVPPPRLFTQDEELRVEELKAEIAILKRRKQAALAQQRSAHRRSGELQSIHKGGILPDLMLQTPPKNGFELTPAKALDFNDNLMDEVINLSNVTDTSLLPHGPISPSFDKSLEDIATLTSSGTYEQNITGSIPAPDTEDRVENEKIDGGRAMTLDIQSGPSPPECDNEQVLAPKEVNTDGFLMGPETPVVSHYRIRMNADIKRIVTKIWQTASDVIAPYCLHNASEDGTSSNSPLPAKETMSAL
ncbi:hypothetical protein AX17_005768 [Amanita inopinata Kibby_2008]|nr:hypothetical protein AX17_005768 [Amanita inopinata Kibby_2008]